jgi:hypothetical protein
MDISQPWVNKQNYTFFLIFSIYFALWPTNAQLFHKLSHSYMFRHYRVILSEILISTLLSYTSKVFQMQLLVIQFTIKMFPIGFMQVPIL